jgi:hypothetical protein
LPWWMFEREWKSERMSFILFAIVPLFSREWKCRYIFLCLWNWVRFVLKLSKTEPSGGDGKVIFTLFWMFSKLWVICRRI